MGRASRASNGLECLGVYRGREKCQRARDKSGLPVLVNQKCKTCGEQRCKAHCKCHRNKTVNCKGKSGPRGVSAVATPSVSPPPPAARPVLAPVGRAPAPFCALVETGAWYRDFCNLVENATEVELASYMYDNTAVQGALLKRLRSRTAFCLNVYVDTEKFASGGPVLQKARLRELRSAGASVYLCKGVGASWLLSLQRCCCGPSASVFWRCKLHTPERRQRRVLLQDDWASGATSSGKDVGAEGERHTLEGALTVGGRTAAKSGEWFGPRAAKTFLVS